MTENAAAIVHLVTGPVSVGKTTAILSLIARKPPNEKWAVLLNTNGGDDVPTLPEQGGVAVREIVGGCVCCATSVVFGVALAQLVRREKPKRVLVEPSGLGEGLRLKEKVRGMGLTLGPVIVMVPADGHAHLWHASRLYRNQLSCADVFVINRTDEALDGGAGAVHFAKNFFPPKYVAVAHRGTFPMDLLTVDPNALLVIDGCCDGRNLYDQDDHDDLENDDDDLENDDHDHGQSSPVKKRDVGAGMSRVDAFRDDRLVVGYHISRDWAFHEESLMDLGAFRKDPLLDRAKALFRCQMGYSRLVHWRGAAGDGELYADPVTLATEESRIHLTFLPLVDVDDLDAYRAAVDVTCHRLEAHLAASGVRSRPRHHRATPLAFA